jgi:hypothetical protein
MIAVVTGFVPIPNHPRPASEYRQLGERLLNARVPHGDATLMALEMKLTDCWLYQWLNWRGEEFTHSVSDNPKKNTPAYHIVQAQKTEFVLEAARTYRQDIEVYVWVDFGIFHLTGMNDEVLVDFLRRAKNEKSITIPGCWDKNYTYDDDHPCWRFCGGVMIVPRRYVLEFDLAMKAEYLRWIKATNRLSWEVNTLARLEKERPDLPIWWFKADHNVTMFMNYQCGRDH